MHGPLNVKYAVCVCVYTHNIFAIYIYTYIHDYMYDDKRKT
jgi:hypothetical protein